MRVSRRPAEGDHGARGPDRSSKRAEPQRRDPGGRAGGLADVIALPAGSGTAGVAGRHGRRDARGGGKEAA